MSRRLCTDRAFPCTAAVRTFSPTATRCADEIVATLGIAGDSGGDDCGGAVTGNRGWTACPPAGDSSSGTAGSLLEQALAGMVVPFVWCHAECDSAGTGPLGRFVGDAACRKSGAADRISLRRDFVDQLFSQWTRPCCRCLADTIAVVGSFYHSGTATRCNRSWMGGNGDKSASNSCCGPACPINRRP